jgi:hypothetical protein
MMCGFGKKIEFKFKLKLSFENVFEKEKAILSPPFLVCLAQLLPTHAPFPSLIAGLAQSTARGNC